LSALAESNAIDLVFVVRGTVPPSIAIIKRIDSRGQSVLQIARLSVEIRMIMKPTSRDKIERSVVIQEPIPSILAIGQSIIVATQVKLRSGSDTKPSTAVRIMPCEVSRRSLMLVGSMAWVKLGQPHPDSYLSEEANKGSPNTMSAWIPDSVLCKYLPGFGSSVALCYDTRNCSAVRREMASGVFL